MMMERKTQLLCAVMVMGAAAGCHRVTSKTATAGAVPVAKAAGSTTTSSPLTYELAREGLPTGRIWKSKVALGDINNDGLPDIGVVSRLADGPYIFTGDGKGHWTDASDGLPRETFCGGGMSFADVNKDGNLDVAIADHCKGVFVYFGDGAGHWKSASSGLATIGSEDVAFGDFNNDGCVDLVIVAAAEEGVRTFKGDCKGSWREFGNGLPKTEWGNAVTVGDVDGDGNMDIAAAYAAGPRVWFGDGKGNFHEVSEGLPAPDVHGLYMFGIALADVNGDGKLDLAATSAVPGIEFFLYDNGKWKASNNGLVPMNALGVAFGDLDKDGKIDMVVAGKTNLQEIGGVYGVFPFMGDGQGNWKLNDATGLPTTGRERTWGVGLSDMDHDGVLDITVAFGDVLSPTYRTGSPQPADPANPAAKPVPPGASVDPKTKGPERGRFGSIDVWRGVLKQ